MTAKIAEFKAAERALAMQYRAFEEMKQDPELKKALEFDTALDDLLAKFKMSRPGLYELLGYDVEPDKPSATKLATVKTPKTKERKKHEWPLRTYVNPNTGQEIKIRMATNAVYTGWVAQYGKETVASWLTHTEKA